VIALPPSNGAVNETVICASPGSAVGGAGGSGTRFGMTAADGADEGLVPFALVAVTVHVYDFPLVRPPTMTGGAGPFADPAEPPFDDVQCAV
jgi:aconitase B